MKALELVTPPSQAGVEPEQTLACEDCRCRDTDLDKYNVIYVDETGVQIRPWKHRLVGEPGLVYCRHGCSQRAGAGFIGEMGSK